MELTLNILETNKSFKNKIFLAICEELTLKFLIMKNKVRDDVAEGVKFLIKNSTDYKILTSDETVIADFGFRVGTQINKINAIIDKVAENIFITEYKPFVPKNNSISGGFSLGILLKDFSDLLSLPEAKNNVEDNYVIEWLSWLLERGDSIIIDNYHIEYGPFGRSGEGHMVIGGVWHVDKLIAGNIKNNWLTRALIDKDGKIRESLKDIILKSVKRNLK